MFSAGITFLPTKNLDLTSKIYREILGLPLRLDQGSCHIFQITPESHIGFCTGLKSVDSPHEIIITLVTDDVDDVYKYLVANGAQADAPPRINEQFQIHHFFITDPNGYRIEIQKFLDPRW
jgi:catechol 2,3-dioxygenase-like lactoylglutathione lyase family enzyme